MNVVVADFVAAVAAGAAGADQEDQTNSKHC